MLNAEKYKNELLKVINENERDFIAFDERDNSVKNCTTMVCNNCKFTRSKAKALCTQTKLKWLLSEYKQPIKLSKFEYDILKYLSDNTRHMYIVRDGNGYICLYDAEPKKSENGDWWVGRAVHSMVMFNKLFQFVQFEDEEPRAIKDILESCEVVNDAEE